MKRLHRAVLHLYPRAWRERYRHEFAALLEDAGAGWQQIPDIFLEALRMRIATINLRFIGIFALLGLAAAILVSLRIPDRFVSVAVVKLLPGGGDDPSQAGAEMAALARSVTSRTSLSNLIQNPAVDLYKYDRSRVPLEDVIADMKAHDISVTLRPDGVTLVSYRGTSPAEAQAVVRLVVDRLRDDHMSRHHIAPSASRLDVIDAPSFDSAPVYPNRLLIVILGIFLGILAAFALVVLRKAPGLWFRGSLALIALAILSWFLPFPHESRAVVVFDSPATARTIRGAMEKFLPPGVTLTPDPQATGLLIQAHNSDRFVAQQLTQQAITRLVDATKWRQGSSQTPWIEVLDPPSLSVFSTADRWRDRVLVIAFGLLLVSGALLLIKRRSSRQVQPV